MRQEAAHFQPSRWDERLCHLFPGVKTPGYSQSVPLGREGYGILPNELNNWHHFSGTKNNSTFRSLRFGKKAVAT